jgi:hypothetical protein
MSESRSRDRGKRVELQTGSHADVVAALNRFLETESHGRIGFEKHGSPSRCGQRRKASLRLLKLSVGFDVNSRYSQTEHRVIFASTARRKWFSVNTCDLVLRRVRGIVQNIIDARLRNFLPRFKGIAYGCAHCAHTPSLLSRESLTDDL